MSEFILKFKCYMLGFSKTLAILLGVCVGWLILYYSYLLGVSEYFNHAYEVGKFFEAICASYICSIIVYFVTCHIPLTTKQIKYEKIVQKNIGFILYKYAQLIGTISPILENSSNVDNFVDNIKNSLIEPKCRRLQTGVFGNIITTKKFTESLYELRNDVSKRINCLPIEVRVDLIKLEFHPLWDFLDESPDYFNQTKQEIVGEYLAKQLYSLKETLENVQTDFNIIETWKELSETTFRDYR